MSLTEPLAVMLWPRELTDGLTRTAFPVSILRSVEASKLPTPASVTLLLMSEKFGMSSSP